MADEFGKDLQIASYRELPREKSFEKMRSINASSSASTHNVRTPLVELQQVKKLVDRNYRQMVLQRENGRLKEL